MGLIKVTRLVRDCQIRQQTGFIKIIGGKERKLFVIA
jgi:hypothetical protein